MAKHTQTIRRQIAYELFDCVWPFCEIGAWRVNNFTVDEINDFSELLWVLLVLRRKRKYYKDNN